MAIQCEGKTLHRYIEHRCETGATVRVSGKPYCKRHGAKASESSGSPVVPIPRAEVAALPSAKKAERALAQTVAEIAKIGAGLEYAVENGRRIRIRGGRFGMGISAEWTGLVRVDGVSGEVPPEAGVRFVVACWGAFKAHLAA